VISSISVVLYTCIFLLPGVIIEEVVGLISPLKRNSAAKQSIMWIGYSVLNDAIWSWLFWLVVKHVDNNTLTFWIVLAGVMFISSLLTGLGLGLVRSNDLIRRFAAKFKINLEHPIPTAWEYKFSKQREPCWLIITLRNGIYFGGYYGCESLASSEQSYNDIYLELVYNIDEKNIWRVAQKTDGVWINPNDISSIEFFNIEGENDYDKGETN